MNGLFESFDLLSGENFPHHGGCAFNKVRATVFCAGPLNTAPKMGKIEDRA